MYKSIEKPEILIILPVLNEIANIEKLLDKIDENLADEKYLVCLIDDGSTDGTKQYIEERQKRDGRLELLTRVKLNHGCQRGSALRIGLEFGIIETECEIFIEMDGDLSHRPEELPTGIGLLRRGNDVVIASKYVPGSQVVGREVDRRLFSRMCGLFVRYIIEPRIKDYSNGYRFYNRKAALVAANAAYKYGSPIYLSEVLAVWLKRKLKIAEFPSTYVGRDEGASKLRITDLFKATIALPEIAFRYHFGKIDTTAHYFALYEKRKVQTRVKARAI